MASSGTGTGSPCGACKFLRRKCASDCIFAPYFCSEQGPARFAAIHKVFGASNVSKLLLHVPAAERFEAVVTIAYEAQVACLQAQLMQVKAQLAQNLTDSPRINLENIHHQWQGNNISGVPSFPNYINPISPQSSLDSADLNSNNIDHGIMNMQEIQSREEYFAFQSCAKVKRPCPSDLGELQALAIRMMRN
ncbi:LOB DOMAIN CONTAINING PROTEIN [Salix koriyanagi]|uniref:LOB DOMAIN CONTAINING PROTEIN n=1 Tax=Salix koriyanagi TaxID=2511006 RepID=A0A9Q0P3Z8_9ROSI|nr:LOB DOMAIN CONTAINING PROTEIN [Salix koriyanagi]